MSMGRIVGTLTGVGADASPLTAEEDTTTLGPMSMGRIAGTPAGVDIVSRVAVWT
jgi:hypothetical protein